MNRNQIRTRTPGVTQERERRYQVWVGGCFTGTVDAAERPAALLIGPPVGPDQTP